MWTVQKNIVIELIKYTYSIVVQLTDLTSVLELSYHYKSEAPKTYQIILADYSYFYLCKKYYIYIISLYKSIY